MFDEAWIENLNGNRAINEQMTRAIDGSHAADTQSLFEAILIVECMSYEWVDRCGGNCRCVSLQWRLVFGTDLHVGRVVSSACGAMKHNELSGESACIIT